jgi:hypothetical protein
MPEISFPEVDKGPEVEVDLEPELEVETHPDVEDAPEIEVIFEEDPIGRRRRVLVVRVVVAAIALAALVAAGVMIIDAGSDPQPAPAGDVTSPGTT